MIKDKAIETFHKVKIRVYKNKSVNYYLEKGNNLLETGKVNKAYRVFKRCLRDFPTDEKIHASIIKYALQTGKLDLVNVHWGKIDNFKKVNLPADAYINYAKMLQKYNDLQRAMDILILGVTTCSDNKEILSVISEQMPIETNDQISNKSKKLLDEFVDQAIQNRDWNMSIQRIEEVCSIYKQNVQFKYQIKLSMLYQVVGSHRQASHILNRLLHKYSEEILEDEKGYRKIVLYDNGESRIEFYKSLQKTNRVVVTFDSINMVWDNPSFAFNLLIQQNVDIIAIRKRRKKVYQQDLSLEDFKRTVSALVEGYEDKVAYGFSLGAYGALYYASALNCRILALSPRMSIHPIYGKSNLKGKRIFKHNILPTHNSEISPIIVYDPKNALDNTYVNKGLLSAFPNAQLVEIPYAGHGMGPHLKQMGLLKEFILTVIHKAEIPIYDKELRKKSQTYYRVLGDACLKRNKPRWALQLVNYALTLAPEDSLCMRLKIHVLRRKERYTEAIQFAESSRELAPQDRVIPGLLIDLYVYIGDFEKAIEETEAAIKKFGSTAPLLKRKKRIQELQEKHVHNAVKL